MKTNHISIIALLFCLLISCKETKQKPNSKILDSSKASSITEDTSLLDKCINAHGGIKKWKSFTGISYNLEENGKTVYQLTNIKDRRAYLKSDDYEVGFDGKVAWAKPDASKIPGKSAAFYYNLDFYFLGVPFLLKDPGVVATDEGASVINGENYETLKITFGSEVGLSPEDVYYLYLDPETFRLEILTYSVSYFDKKNAQINSAKTYSEYQEVQGLMMPTELENFAWEDGELGESTNHVRHFSDIRFLDKIPDESIFQAPEGSITERIN
ncbi:hypothetical protein D9O36_19130 [Zobellia amurskyensis]|uniref:Outer membrane lipoprotein-sorting protein n=1 Tax=Zobellia amurskyensis TaxID=248905 RepID=A0A7X3D452_9FLAO|nr:DUF6503 family protein [Zobellia amurskyensis]MUH37971.1 hypothetical protein [Zobellia amurskyensis]